MSVFREYIRTAVKVRWFSDREKPLFFLIAFNFQQLREILIGHNKGGSTYSVNSNTKLLFVNFHSSNLVLLYVVPTVLGLFVIHLPKIWSRFKKFGGCQFVCIIALLIIMSPPLRREARIRIPVRVCMYL